MKLYNYDSTKNWAEILKRPMMDTQRLETTVQAVLEEVKQHGDEALKAYTTRFDQVELKSLAVTFEEVATAIDKVDDDLKAAIQLAHQNIHTFHAAQQQSVEVVETMPGVRCWRKSVGIEKVGLYIPGGTAPLFSTILMLGVPAKLAGCREIILCTPPQKDGSIHPAILYTAHLVGITQIFKVGGAQAVAGMAYGTESIPAVYKIFGPGNQYVTAAKQLVNKSGTAIDMPAGPSEVLVCADESAEPAFVAADLLSQAEHGVDSQVVLIAFSENFVQRVQQEIDKQLQELPRKALAEKALANSSSVIVSSRQVALDLINIYAPEHLIVAVEEVEQFVEGIINAGSIFMGNFTPESVGDYASGTNHTLPTNGFATAYSGVSLDSFVKKITFQQLSQAGLRNVGPAVEKMARAEELEAHRNAVSIRLISEK
ncbi:MAG: histidinol dehydrogenase [Bacteroidota bacterium]